MIGDAAAIFGLLGAFAVVILMVGSVFLWDLITRPSRRPPRYVRKSRR